MIPCTLDTVAPLAIGVDALGSSSFAPSSDDETIIDSAGGGSPSVVDGLARAVGVAVRSPPAVAAYWSTIVVSSPPPPHPAVDSAATKMDMLSKGLE